MAYRQPGITVTQNFLNAQAALAAFSLPNVIVGPAFQVVKQAAAGAYASTLQAYAYPNKIAGTYVDQRAADPTDLVSYPIRIFLQSPIVQLVGPLSTGAVISGYLNQFTDATAGAFTGIKAGDVIVVTGTLAGTYTVRSVVNANTLQTNETFASASASLNYTIRRNIAVAGAPLEIPTSTAGVVITAATLTLPAALTTAVTGFGSVPILSATVLLSYRALRFDGSADLVEYADIPALQGAFDTDQIVPENVAVFGAYVALSNSVTPTNILELPQDYLNTGSGSGDENIAYGKAMDVLALNDIYAIALMTQNTSVHTVLKAHVDGYSQPSMGLERVGIVNRQLVTTAIVAEQATDGAVDSTGLVFTSASGLFVTDDVVPGMFINISAPSLQAGRYKILSVDSQTQVTLYPISAGGVIIPGGPLTGITFVVDENLTLQAQADTIAAYASSLGDRRMVLTWPDQVKIPSGNVVRTLPGYFLNSSVAALTTGLPTQQGLTNLTLALYTGVVHSAKYFTQAQMNTIAGGGVMVFTQDILDQTPLFIRHQLTTDTSTIMFQEYSVTKNVDFVAKFIRQNHAKFIGQYNIVDGAFDDLKTKAKGIFNFLSSNPLPKLGAVIKSGKLVSIAQDLQLIDTINETYSISIPVPLNNINITLNISS